MPMYNLIEYSDAYSKTSGGLWQYYRDEPATDNDGKIIDFPASNNNRNKRTEKRGQKKEDKQETMAQKMLK